MMVVLVIGIAIGALLVMWHRETLRAAEERIREEMEVEHKKERRQQLAERVRLYREICDLQQELAAAETRAERAFQDGRTAADRERGEKERFIRTYEGQAVQMALAIRKR